MTQIPNKGQGQELGEPRSDPNAKIHLSLYPIFIVSLFSMMVSTMFTENKAISKTLKQYMDKDAVYIHSGI